VIFKTMVFIFTSTYAIQLMSIITKVVRSIPIFNLLWVTASVMWLLECSPQVWWIVGSRPGGSNQRLSVWV